MIRKVRSINVLVQPKSRIFQRHDSVGISYSLIDHNRFLRLFKWELMSQGRLTPMSRLHWLRNQCDQEPSQRIHRFICCLPFRHIVVAAPISWLKNPISTLGLLTIPQGICLDLHPYWVFDVIIVLTYWKPHSTVPSWEDARMLPLSDRSSGSSPLSNNLLGRES